VEDSAAVLCQARVSGGDDEDDDATATATARWDWWTAGRPACVRERARESTASASHHLARPAPLVPRAPAEMLFFVCKIVCFSLVEITW
jgi:hypothetical protein